mmetsp:Transcript_26681/g.64642  ORF Transcript_26681/g.64642 Transcript_26681/m.64642 type:complete len:139 (-) Transcript_26681:909-1325(-)
MHGPQWHFIGVSTTNGSIALKVLSDRSGPCQQIHSRHMKKLKTKSAQKKRKTIEMFPTLRMPKSLKAMDQPKHRFEISYPVIRFSTGILVIHGESGVNAHVHNIELKAIRHQVGFSKGPLTNWIKSIVRSMGLETIKF